MPGFFSDTSNVHVHVFTNLYRKFMFILCEILRNKLLNYKQNEQNLFSILTGVFRRYHANYSLKIELVR